jgi:hypothetical protein
MRKILSCAFFLLSAFLLSPAMADADIEVRVEDLSSRFVDFYNAASEPGVDEPRRWALWQQRYGFAAVPADARGQAQARQMLREAWPLYPKAIDRILAGYGGMRPSPESQLRAAAELLKLDRPLKVTILAYVGMFEGNAFTTAVEKGQATVALPIEDEPQHRAVTAAHELTHAVHIALGSLDSEAKVATIALSEGLAMHASQALVPGGKLESYVELTPGWFARAKVKEREILRNIRPRLAARDGATLYRFTMDKGPTGLEREAYYAGWRVVGAWLAEGRSLAEIARIPPQRAAAEFDATIGRLLATKPSGPAKVQ